MARLHRRGRRAGEAGGHYVHDMHDVKPQRRASLGGAKRAWEAPSESPQHASPVLQRGFDGPAATAQASCPAGPATPCVLGRDCTARRRIHVTAGGDRPIDHRVEAAPELAPSAARASGSQGYATPPPDPGAGGAACDGDPVGNAAVHGSHGRQAVATEGVQDFTLSEMQSTAEDCALRGCNLFITDCAGTGKSAIGGVTLHTFAGIGKGGDSREVLADFVRGYDKIRRRFCRTNVLLIDEVDYVMRACCAEQLGSKLVLSLLPFGVAQAGHACLAKEPKCKEPRLAFKSWAWQQCHFVPVVLEVFRQRDPEFCALLSNVRLGIVKRENLALLNSLRPAVPGGGDRANVAVPPK
ncbi:hypothetical protein WJX81_003351 [Elliptochloris bilobata]|uniref:Uncharacterized protein n=1 Tax=Elliptochloris bilobata TaxID=381761 RepID=A0AAW1R0J8_9CHLO